MNGGVENILRYVPFLARILSFSLYLSIHLRCVVLQEYHFMACRRDLFPQLYNGDERSYSKCTPLFLFLLFRSRNCSRNSDLRYKMVLCSAIDPEIIQAISGIVMY